MGLQALSSMTRREKRRKQQTSRRGYLPRERDVVERIYYLQLEMRRSPATAKGKYDPAVLAPFI
jgi:hypothetical protein